ncbi:MAG TPA: cytochrome c [Devosia sp.]|nr:cytochrome c [Devosia sp.]
MNRLAIILAVTLLGGCEQKMADMPRIDPLAATPLFDDGASARPQVEGTLAVDETTTPPPAVIDLQLLQRGRQRYEVFCAPCHDYTGHGHGMVVQRGFPSPPDFHDPALLAAPDRHFYDVITHGYGAMYSYAARVPESDRWAITAYIRALQYAEQVPTADLSAAQRARLDEAKP